MSRKTSSSVNSSIILRPQVICPHCWFKFPPEDIKWIAAHPDLVHDPRLGSDAQLRFHPTRFNVAGKAIDANGTSCRELACPHCHLVVAHDLLHMEPLFISIVGAPTSGKSYFLTSMTWQLRNTLRDRFDLSFGDADPTANLLLGSYEELLFLNPEKDHITTLPKTQGEHGKFFQSVKLDGRDTLIPRPFVFSLEPASKHPAHEASRKISRALCLYDNAGEQFMPGGSLGSDSTTRHLASSKALLFLFDPTQHVHFRDACANAENLDPQMADAVRLNRQDTILGEVAKRVRSEGQIGNNKKDTRPLIVVVTKFDAWNSLMGGKTLDIDWVVRKMPEGGAALDVGMLKAVSRHVQDLMLKYAPEVVAAAEGFSSHVIYIPVSALGTHPEINPDTGFLGVRPRNIKPQWAEVPMLYALHCTTKGLVRVGESSGDRNPFKDGPFKDGPIEQRAARSSHASNTAPTPPVEPSPAAAPRDGAADETTDRDSDDGGIDLAVSPRTAPEQEAQVPRKNIKETGS